QRGADGLAVHGRAQGQRPAGVRGGVDLAPLRLTRAPSVAWDRAALGTLAALVAVRMVAGFQFHALAVVAPLLVAELGLSYTEAGSLIGAYVLPAVLLSIPGGV